MHCQKKNVTLKKKNGQEKDETLTITFKAFNPDWQSVSANILSVWCKTRRWEHFVITEDKRKRAALCAWAMHVVSAADRQVSRVSYQPPSRDPLKVPLKLGQTLLKPINPLTPRDPKSLPLDTARWTPHTHLSSKLHYMYARKLNKQRAKQSYSKWKGQRSTSKPKMTVSNHLFNFNNCQSKTQRRSNSNFTACVTGESN